MKINQYLVKTACPSINGTVRSEHRSGVFLKHIQRAGLLAVALGAIVVLATGCSSTDTGFGARLIDPVPNSHSAMNSDDGSSHRPLRSPGFNSDFGS